MESKTDLKSRFDRLQTSQETAVSQSTKIESVTAKVDLASSSNPQVHEAVKNCESGESYNWRQEWHKGMKRPAELPSTSPYVFDLQSKIQSLTGKPALFSCYETANFEKQLPRLTSYITGRARLWSQVLAAATHIHVRFEKSKFQLWVRSNESTFTLATKIKNMFENEYLTNSKQLKSYGIQVGEDWVEVHLDINDRPADFSEKGNYV